MGQRFRDGERRCGCEFRGLLRGVAPAEDFRQRFQIIGFQKGFGDENEGGRAVGEGDALGAVTVPEPSVIKAGRIPLNFSSLRGMETFSSLSTTVGGLPLGPGISTGQISSLKAPEEVAAWAFWMERMA